MYLDQDGLMSFPLSSRNGLVFRVASSLRRGSRITSEAFTVQQTGKPAFSICRAQPAGVELPYNAPSEDWPTLTAQSDKLRLF